MRLIEPCVSRADEFLDATDWVLSRTPSWGWQLTDNVWKVQVNREAFMNPGLTLYYTFDENNVYYLHVTKDDPSEIEE